MASNKMTKNRCGKCEEIQCLYLTSLEDKRNVLVRLQKEQENVLKLRREIEDFKKVQRQALITKSTAQNHSNTVNSTTKGLSELEKRLNEAMSVNRKWKEEYEQLKEKYNTEVTNLQNEVTALNQRIEECNTHIFALESENIRLAQTIAIDDRTQPQHKGRKPDAELVEFQMQTYKEDFSSERRDRERTQSEKENLQEQLASAQEIISTLTQETELYKVQHLSDQEEIRQLMNQFNVPQPQFQIVYPIVDQNQHQQQRQWRRQQQRRGILTRGPCSNAPPSAFYGGDVEVDQADSSKPTIPDGYRSV